MRITHNWFVGVQIGTRSGTWCSKPITSGTSAATSVSCVDYNTIEGDLFDGRLNRLNPAFGGIDFRAMTARASTTALQLQLNKRYSHGFSGPGLVYLWHDAYDTGSDVQVGALQMDAVRSGSGMEPGGLRRAPPRS